MKEMKKYDDDYIELERIPKEKNKIYKSKGEFSWGLVFSIALGIIIGIGILSIC